MIENPYVATLLAFGDNGDNVWTGLSGVILGLLLGLGLVIWIVSMIRK